MGSKARLLAASLLLACGAVPAQEPAAPSVVVRNTRDPVDKSYRKMLSGIARFERDHALAPGATLRFRLLPRTATVDMKGIELKVVGDTASMTVPIAQDNSFTLARNDVLLREDAALIANRRTSSMTWRAEVRSPGVPDGMRRLGDLRLECLVGIDAGLVSNNAQLFRWLGELFTNADRVCGDPDGNYLFFTERPVFAVIAQHGERRETMPFRMTYANGGPPASELPYCDCQVLLDRSYFAPIWDRSWPDDTLLSFEYMDDPPQPDAAPSSREEARAALGPPLKELRFDRGYEIWLYEWPPARKLPPGQDKRPQIAEQVLLFDSDGSTRKTRRREP
ncbi:hypothetical protein ACHMW6_30800 [Pseudoduganella sp. UC29_106]|uniref:hypothetical protein n=1 Tax=Pseudoduganella sp. UC29_106 TaxID=3374553 RepID=UPI0037577852